jgi:hypothetical protein
MENTVIILPSYSQSRAVASGTNPDLEQQLPAILAISRQRWEHVIALIVDWGCHSKLTLADGQGWRRCVLGNDLPKSE